MRKVVLTSALHRKYFRAAPNQNSAATHQRCHRRLFGHPLMTVCLVEGEATGLNFVFLTGRNKTASVVHLDMYAHDGGVVYLNKVFCFRCFLQPEKT